MVFALLFLGTTPYLMVDVFATFPGINGQIAFDVAVDTGFADPRDVWTMDPDGSDKQNISNSPNSFDGDAYCSADGTKFVFESTRDTPNERQLFVMKTDGSDQTNISNNAFNEGSPGWSPDGTQVVFESDRDGDGRDIWRMDANGNNPVQLTDDIFSGNPNWSPDGTLIVFQQNGIVVMSAVDGSGQTTISAGGDPDWSPDGTQIVFRLGNGIWVMDANGDNPQEINDNGGNPNWSPDGTQIVFDRFTEGPRQIFVMDANGDNPINISDDDETNSRPHWCPIIPTPVVGGELLPIDSTALILAGAQTNSVWILSALAVIGSVAFGALYITSKKN